MARLAWFLVPLGGAAIAVGACGDSGGTGGTGPGSGPSGPVTVGSTNASTGASTNGGDCQTNTDCAPDGQCVELTPGGFRTCQFPPTPNTQCGLGQGGGGVGGGGGAGGGPVVLDECCEEIDDEDCGNDTVCITTPSYPSCDNNEPPHNVCQDDAHECDNSQDCNDNGPGLCVPAGTLGGQVRHCIRIGCAQDTECTAGANGRCVPIEQACCPGATLGLYCTYDGGCRKDSDCPGGTCRVMGGVASCQPMACN